MTVHLLPSAHFIDELKGTVLLVRFKIAKTQIKEGEGPITACSSHNVDGNGVRNRPYGTSEAASREEKQTLLGFNVMNSSCANLKCGIAA